MDVDDFTARIVGLLEDTQSLGEGEPPWEPDIREGEEPFEIDMEQLETDQWAFPPDGDRGPIANEREIREIVETAERSQVPIPPVPPAWYQPIHYFKWDWGIFIRQDGLLNLATSIDDHARNYLGVHDPYSALRSAFSILYQHEYYHHKLEYFAIQNFICSYQHGDRRPSPYVPYIEQVYHPSKGTSHQLEETLANAYMYRNFPGGKFKKLLNPSYPKLVKDFLINGLFPAQAPSYNLAGHYCKPKDFEAGKRQLWTQVVEGTSHTQGNPDIWRLTPGLDRSPFTSRSNPRIFTVVPAGQRSILPVKVRGVLPGPTF